MKTTAEKNAKIDAFITMGDNRYTFVYFTQHVALY